MKKRMSLINLNNNEIKKNEKKQLLSKELENAKGGAKCAQPMCFCNCYPLKDFLEDNVKLSQKLFLENHTLPGPEPPEL
jgi:hypothetical protein